MQSKKMRLDKFLVHIGYGSRSEVQKIIKQKRVTLDGNTVSKPDISLDPEKSSVCVDSKVAVYSEFYYFVLHKPDGVITATEDSQQRTVLDLLNPEDKNKMLAPVGRLDKDTEGLLILTNDGKLTHQLLSPKKHVEKVYYAEVKGCVTAEDVRCFEAGITLKDGTAFLPAKLEILEAGELSKVNVTICEGKFHQVKKMALAIGKEVTYLKRIKMGGLTLPADLARGEYRQLSDQELQLLKGDD